MPEDDVLGPQKVGMKACLIDRKGDKNPDSYADFVISDLRELYGIIGG